LTFVRSDGIVAHWDIDGIASAVLIARHYNIPIDNIRLSSTSRVYKFVKELVSIGLNHIFVLDLNLNEKVTRDIARLTRKRGIGITIVDHHEWSQSTLEFVESLHNLRLILGSSYPCTAKLVHDSILSSAPLREEYKLLLDMAIDDDTYSNKIPLTSKWRVLLRWGDWGLRYRTLEYWLDGLVWPEWAEIEFQKIWKEYERLIYAAVESVEDASVEGTRILFVYPDQKVHPGDLQHYLENIVEKKADVYVFVYGKSVSLRSAKLNVAEIARILGGGGHKKAAGASLNVSDKSSIKNTIISLFSRAFSKRGEKA